jgi:hypothetical protein
MDADTIKDLADVLGAESYASDSPCACGTCQDAFEAAYRLYERMLASDCPLWRSRVVMALSVLNRAEEAARAFGARGMPPSVSLTREGMEAESKTWDTPKTLAVVALLSALETNYKTTAGVMGDVVYGNQDKLQSMFSCVEVVKPN